jgi:hypothetical protein
VDGVFETRDRRSVRRWIGQCGGLKFGWLSWGGLAFDSYGCHDVLEFRARFLSLAIRATIGRKQSDLASIPWTNRFKGFKKCWARCRRRGTGGEDGGANSKGTNGGGTYDEPAPRLKEGERDIIRQSPTSHSSSNLQYKTCNLENFPLVVAFSIPITKASYLFYTPLL